MLFSPSHNKKQANGEDSTYEGSTQEVAAEYESELAELSFNSKPIINNLTIIAGENQQAADQIVRVIEARIKTVSQDKKLPALYLLDSICKNIGGVYLQLFVKNIVQIFSDTFTRADSATRTSMSHLMKTWANLFPSEVMQQLERKVTALQAPQPPKKLVAAPKQAKAPTKASSVIVNPNFVAKKAPNNHNAAPQQPTKRQPPKQTPKTSVSRVDDIIQGQRRTQAKFQTPVPLPPRSQNHNQPGYYNDPSSAAFSTPPAFTPQDISLLQYQIQQQMAVILNVLQTQLSTQNLSQQDQFAILQQLQTLQQLQQQTQLATSGQVLQSQMQVLQSMYPFTTGGAPPTVFMANSNQGDGSLGMVPSAALNHMNPLGAMTTLGNFQPPVVAPPLPPIPMATTFPQTALPTMPTPQFYQPPTSASHLLSNLQAFGLLKPSTPAPLPMLPTAPPQLSSSRGNHQPPIIPVVPPTNNVQTTQPSHQQKKPRALLDPWSPEALKARDESVVNDLYFDFPLQCKNCGLRFADRKKMDIHLDWHFVQNRKEKEKVRKAMSRSWNQTKEEWVVSTEMTAKSSVPFPFGDGKEAEDEKKEEEVVSVPADESQTHCPKCGEQFEQYYDPELDEWMYKDCVKLDDGNTICHLKCAQSDTTTGPKIPTPPVTPTPPPPTTAVEVVATVTTAAEAPVELAEGTTTPTPMVTLPSDMPPLEDNEVSALTKKRLHPEHEGEEAQLEEDPQKKQKVDLTA